MDNPRLTMGAMALRTRTVIGLAAAGVLLMLAHGCAAQRYVNSVPYIQRRIRASRESRFLAQFKATVLYPARDLLTLDPVWRVLCGDEAWNAAEPGVTGSSFLVPHREDELSPAEAAAGPNPEQAPVQPLRVDRVKTDGASAGFFGTDATGRQFLVKLDRPAYPELGSSATLIAARVYHALGYRVPPTFLVTIRGTGDERFDGRLAVAAALVPDVIGQFKFDWFRYRREVRGLRLVAAWLNDTDRTSSNTLVSVRDGVAHYFLIDFDSALGAWQGRPKAPWRGWRHEWGSVALFAEVLTLGLIRSGHDPDQPVISPAVGRLDARFEPMTWRPQVANTAFDHMTATDRDWILRRIARLKRPHLEAIVDAAGLSDPADRAYLVETLLARQSRILALETCARGGG